jgi:DNA repair protein RadC
MVVSRKKSELTSSAKVYEHLKKILAKLDELDRDKEHFYVILLNARNRAIITDLVSVGTVNASLVHPREVFRRAIQLAASHIIVAHNHPSGGLEPSAGDLEVTKRLKDAGKILGIELIDHLIIADEDYHSIYQRG